MSNTYKQLYKHQNIVRRLRIANMDIWRRFQDSTVIFNWTTTTTTTKKTKFKTTNTVRIPVFRLFLEFSPLLGKLSRTSENYLPRCTQLDNITCMKPPLELMIGARFPVEKLLTDIKNKDLKKKITLAVP